MVREPDATMQPTSHDLQLMSKHRILSFKLKLRLEWRVQDGQNETEQPDHSASLGDSITSSTRIRLSVHTLLRVAGQPDQFLGVDQDALGARRDLFPQGVSITWRWLRSNSVMPSRASSSLVPPLSVDYVTAQLFAARPKWHCSARAHKKRSC